MWPLRRSGGTGWPMRPTNAGKANKSRSRKKRTGAKPWLRLSPTVGSGKVRPITRVVPIPRPVGETEGKQEATPAQAPEPAGPVIELVEITDQDLANIILYNGFAL